MSKKNKRRKAKSFQPERQSFDINRITVRNANQELYLDALDEFSITIALGAAGVGKTMLAVAYALYMLKEKQVSKIIITRPVKEAGENLGFLPGDLREKLDPYLRPIVDFLRKFLSKSEVERLFNEDIIEVVPLAFMRGRNLDDAFIILDEAQNTTPNQMKMFLTRIGRNSQAVVTGDPAQTDIGGINGLVEAVRVLESVDDVSIIRFTKEDICRSPIVVKVVEAYDKYKSGNSGDSD